MEWHHRLLVFGFTLLGTIALKRAKHRDINMNYLELLFVWTASFHLGWCADPDLVIFGIFSITITDRFRADRLLCRMFRSCTNKNNADDSNQISTRSAAGIRSAERVAGGNTQGSRLRSRLGLFRAVFWNVGPSRWSGMAPGLCRMFACQLSNANRERHTYAASGMAANHPRGLGKEYRLG